MCCGRSGCRPSGEVRPPAGPRRLHRHHRDLQLHRLRDASCSGGRSGRTRWYGPSPGGDALPLRTGRRHLHRHHPLALQLLNLHRRPVLCTFERRVCFWRQLEITECIQDHRADQPLHRLHGGLHLRLGSRRCRYWPHDDL